MQQRYIYVHPRRLFTNAMIYNTRTNECAGAAISFTSSVLLIAVALGLGCQSTVCGQSATGSGKQRFFLPAKLSEVIIRTICVVNSIFVVIQPCKAPSVHRVAFFRIKVHLHKKSLERAYTPTTSSRFMPTAIAPIAPRQLMVKQRRSLVMIYRRGWLQLAGLCEVRQRSLHFAHFHQTKPSAIIEDVLSGANRLRHGDQSYISRSQDPGVGFSC